MSADPWMKWYWSDWRADPSLRMCSMAARGLWAEMIALMSEAEPKGFLRIAGRVPTDAQLAVLAGAPPEQIPEWLGELESAGVFSRTKEGVIFSRRMVSDEKKARTARRNGKFGGNPTLSKERRISPSDKGRDNPGVKTQKPEARGQKEERVGFDRELFPPSAPPPAKPPDDDAVERAVAIFNAMAVDTGWPKVGKITPQRRSAIRARLRDCGGIEGWRLAMERAARSAFLRGDNCRGWRADLDFFLQAKSFTKLIEGAFDDNRAPLPTASRGASTITDEQWETFVARHRQDPSQWPFGALGPPPDEPGCRAPVDILVRHGFRRSAAA